MPIAQRIGLLFTTGLVGLALGCQSPRNAPTEPAPQPDNGAVAFKPTPYPWQKPANFPEPVYAFDRNPLTVEGVALGKALFYDDNLSRNGTISCAFCHQQPSAFSHADHSLSHGIDDRIGTRNPQTVQNMAWNRHFFWDGGIADLDVLPIAPIENPVEMDHKLPKVLDYIRKNGNYRAMFRRAYGTDSITTERFLKALSQFMLTMVSANSRYDRYVRNESGVTTPGGQLTPDELAGLTLFRQKCATCHQGELFTDGSFRNNGLPVGPINDQGRYTITLAEADRLKFSVPTLRNIERSVPYMHDGRFFTLEDVLDHYDRGVKDSPTLDPLLKQNGRLGIPLSATEKGQLIAFLRTLTDNTFLTNRRFQPD